MHSHTQTHAHTCKNQVNSLADYFPYTQKKKNKQKHRTKGDAKPSKQHMITLGNTINKTKKKSYKKSKENKLPQKNCYPINNLWLSYTEENTKKRQASKEKKKNNFINKK